MSAIDARRQSPPLIIALLPLAMAVFVAFFVIGMAMPVLPLHIEQRLGLGTFAVGMVAGSQFAVSLASRFWAGRFADRRGSKRAVVIGMGTATVAGGVYLLSMALTATPIASVVTLLLGRAILGAAESFVITGALSWGLALGGPTNAGKVIAWLGMPMYAAFALGAPAGSWLYGLHGFSGIAVATMVTPLAGLLLIAPFAALAPSGARPASFRSVIGIVTVPGLGLALGSVGFGAVTIFIALLFAREGWSSAWGAFTAVSTMFILARVLFGHLPDRIGGRRVALASIVVEAIGLLLVWQAATPALAFAGAGLVGFGYSLVYPGFGVAAVRRAPPENRGLVMGAYTACLDLGLGVAGPLLGLVAGRTGVDMVFPVSAAIVFAAAGIALRMAQGDHDSA